MIDLVAAALDPRKEQSVSSVSSDMGHDRLRRANKASDFIVAGEGN